MSLPILGRTVLFQVGARGSVKRTEKGELSVYARECTLLTKALRPLPDKWAGLTDVSKRYRQRYLDMIVNPGVRATFQARGACTKAEWRPPSKRGAIFSGCSCETSEAWHPARYNVYFF